ncbi:hypothetical protein [Micromonospora rifamycinica]|uniref:Uncharacterized protein n=1 Tax=Micromonospora rifamycinica TaxID=291594 RepID=A0A109IHP5_9ACTN|nr:hypothetical protein [Micromonospora rifamycinica]KWV30721.1 hypothetical protein AWV63_21495 [Micromonospora rifamycinica]SCG81132.1 hypothetical protein GA0070623_5505 [Micromonospora rifamycinica]
MADYDEYAAAVRQLSTRIREGGSGAAAEAERRRALSAGVDQLGQRLAAQEQRLDQLGAAAGLSPVVDAADRGPAADRAPGSGPASVAGRDIAATAGASAAGRDAAATVGASAAGRDAAATVGADGDADGDPAVALAQARRLVDEADRLGGRAEALARRPALLPTWSPTARAVAVYLGCAATGALAMLALVVANGSGLVDGVTLGALTCAGLPLISFVTGWLVLGRWGRPALAGADASRFAPLGFVICALLLPSTYCVVLLLVRFLG